MSTKLPELNVCADGETIELYGQCFLVSSGERQPQREAFTAAIVARCNAHDELVATLAALIQAAPDPCGYEKTLPHYFAAWDNAQTALAKVSL